MKILLVLTFTASLTFANDWPQWRGPDRNNHAASDARPVTEWSSEKNVRWKTAIPGRGHSSPIVVGENIYLTTADKEKNTQSLIALNRADGEILWEKIIHQGGFPSELHQENSAASATAQWDGTNVLVVFENDQKIKVTAVSPKGEIVWTKTLGDYLPSFHFGYGSTPVFYKENLIVVIGTVTNGSLISLKTKEKPYPV